MDGGWLKYIESIEARLASMESKMDSIIAFRWQIIGGSVVISLIIGVIFQIILAKISAG